MKKYVLLLFAAAATMFVSCGTSVERDQKMCEENYHVIVLDSCEYYSNDKRWDLTHKGNCKYCAERRRNEMVELASMIQQKIDEGRGW